MTRKTWERAYLGFTPDAVGSIDPDVLGLDDAVLGQVQVLLQGSGVGGDGGSLGGAGQRLCHCSAASSRLTMMADSVWGF